MAHPKDSLSVNHTFAIIDFHLFQIDRHQFDPNVAINRNHIKIPQNLMDLSSCFSRPVPLIRVKFLRRTNGQTSVPYSRDTWIATDYLLASRLSYVTTSGFTRAVLLPVCPPSSSISDTRHPHTTN